MKHIPKSNPNIYIRNKTNKKDHWDSGKPRRQQTTLCDIQINVTIIKLCQIFVYHSDILPLKSW